MKNLINISLIMVLTLACENHESDIVPLAPGLQGSVQTGDYFEATVELQRTSISALDFIPEQIMTVRYGGDGASNMMGPVNFKSNHEALFSSEHVVNIDYGQFTLSNKEARDAIFGTYEGVGSNWTMKITGGSGKFISAKGTLFAVIVFGSTNHPLVKISGSIFSNGS